MQRDKFSLIQGQKRGYTRFFHGAKVSFDVIAKSLVEAYISQVSFYRLFVSQYGLSNSLPE